MIIIKYNHAGESHIVKIPVFTKGKALRELHKQHPLWGITIESMEVIDDRCFTCRHCTILDRHRGICKLTGDNVANNMSCEKWER